MSLQLKLFTLCYNPSLVEFDDSDVARFLSDKELVEVRDHFFVHQGMPHLTLLILYNARISTELPMANKNKNLERFNPREFLDEVDWTLYTTLREWRNDYAKSEGIPPYVIANNRQLAEIAKNRPDNIEKLKRIEGIGKSKQETYGKLILGFVNNTSDTSKFTDNADQHIDDKSRSDSDKSK